MKLVEPSSMTSQWPLTVLVASAFALLLSPSPAVAAGLKLRELSVAAPAAATAAAPAPAKAAKAASPAPAPPPIRPGVAVRITSSKAQLLKDFKGKEIHYDPLMDEMLGKDFVVKEMKYGGVGLASPNGSQDNVWYFPLPSLKPWSATQDGKEAPVPQKAFKAVGLPTRARVDIGPPGRHDAPWDYTIKGRNLMDPIAPPHNERVDLDKAQAFPPWMKVKQVVSVECLEKMHKDPKHLCEPEDYTNYNAVTPTPTTQKPLTPAEAKVLKDKIKHLKSTIKSMEPTKAPETKIDIKNPFASEEVDMNDAVKSSNKHKSKGKSGKKMLVGAKASDQRLPTAGGHVEKV